MDEKYLLALLELTSIQRGPTVEAAIKHLCANMPQTQAAEMHGIKQPALSRVIKRIHDVDQKVKAAVMVKGELPGLNRHISGSDHQFFTSEQIRQRLVEGGGSATWLAQAVISYYRANTPGPNLMEFTTRLDPEAQSLFIQLLQIRSMPGWSDDDLAGLAKDCERFINDKKAFR